MPLMLRCLFERERERETEGGRERRDLEVGSGVGMEIVNVYCCVEKKREVKSMFLLLYYFSAVTSEVHF